MRSATKKKTSITQSARPNPRDYEVIVYWSPDDEAYLAELPDWQHNRTHGATPEEALKNAREVLEMLIANAIKFGEPIPETHGRPSGVMSLRMPVSLHDRLQRRAVREGVSVNTWAINELSRAEGMAAARDDDASGAER
jgi:predicted RNase H-like HicB family nuclease